MEQSSKDSKSNQGKIACVKRLMAILYKHKPLVFFSTGNVKNDTTKVIKHAQSQQ